MLRVAVYATGKDLTFDECGGYKIRLRGLIKRCVLARPALPAAADGSPVDWPHVVEFPDAPEHLAASVRAAAYGATLPQEVIICTAGASSDATIGTVACEHRSTTTTTTAAATAAATTTKTAAAATAATTATTTTTTQRRVQHT